LALLPAAIVEPKNVKLTAKSMTANMIITIVVQSIAARHLGKLDTIVGVIPTMFG
jgi:hypothetical protein